MLTHTHTHIYLREGHTFAILLVDHHHQGQGVSGCSVASVVWPQVSLHVLADLEQHDAVQREPGRQQLVGVHVLDDLGGATIVGVRVT